MANIENIDFYVGNARSLGEQRKSTKKRQLNGGKRDSEDENLVKSGVVTEMNQVTSCQKSRKSKGYKLHILVNTNDAVILSVAALVNFLFYFAAAVAVWDQGALFPLFAVLFSQRVSSHSYETLGEL